MRSAEGNQRSKDEPARRSLKGLLALCLCLLCVVAAHAQSGRRQAPPDPGDAAPGGTRPRKVEAKDRERPPSFIVVTSAPDYSEAAHAYTGYMPQLNFEYLARGGCVLELKGVRGAKVLEDEDVARWEARETALAEDESWVIWMELKWDRTSSSDYAPFRLRYLLFEPGTGKIAASGYGRAVRQTWGGPVQRPGSVEGQVRRAGRNVAEQVVSELKHLP